MFTVLFLVFIIIFFILVYFSSVLYIKYLVILVYIRGVVVFILYISCLCWFVDNRFSKFILLLGIFVVWIFDFGVFIKFSDVGEYLWIYLFFSFLFNGLVIGYSINLFKISGSLRF